MLEPAASAHAIRSEVFSQLGRALASFASKAPWPGHSIGLTEAEYAAFDAAIEAAHVRNAWFTAAEVRHALGALAAMLTPADMGEWLGAYPALGAERHMRTVGIITAGNIPFVGFHDLLCVLLCGHSARVKLSSDDAGLTPALITLLAGLDPELARHAGLVAGKLGPVDAVIATGSNNTARYFAHYFGHVPRIIRKSRNGVAVLDGTETMDELAALGQDVFRYYGLGCRNVGKVFLPMDFDLDRLFRAFFPWADIIRHHKYANNYEYNRAVWMLDRVPITENGFLLMKEDNALASPVAALYYERYADRVVVEARLTEQREQVQCIVGHGHLPFGTAQQPGPGEYADGVDTMEFLLALGYQGTKV